MRVSVDSQAFTDTRFRYLGELLGVSHFDARGRCEAVWLVCYERESYGLSRRDIRIAADHPGFPDAMVQAELAEPVEGNPDMLRVKGLEGRIEWIGGKRAAAKKGGEANRKRWEAIHSGSHKASHTDSHEAIHQGSQLDSPPDLAPAPASEKEREPARAIPGAPDTGHDSRVQAARDSLPPEQSGLAVADHLLAEIRAHSPRYAIQAPESRNTWGHQAIAAMGTGVTVAELREAATWAHRGNPKRWASWILRMRDLVTRRQEILAEAHSQAAPRASPPVAFDWRNDLDLAGTEDRLLAEGKTPPWWTEPARWRMTSSGRFPLRRVQDGREVPGGAP